MLRFVKMHGLGNDFVVVEGFSQVIPPPETWQSLARRLTDRHFGIGADGLVFLLPSRGEVAVVEMRMFNPDGSEAEMCGNAIRCAAKYAYEHLGLGGDTLAIATLAGVKEVRIRAEAGKVATVTVNMGPPALEASAVPVLAPFSPAVNWPLTVEGVEFVVTCLSMGNPHCVSFVPSLEEVDLLRWGPAIEGHPAFPRRVNVEFVQVLSPERLRVKVWERGAGATLACGTGACAAAVAGVLTRVSRNRVRVELPGGELAVTWEGPGEPVWMEGPAAEVFRGEVGNEVVG